MLKKLKNLFAKKPEVKEVKEPKKKEEPLPDNIIVGTGYHNSNNHL